MADRLLEIGAAMVAEREPDKVLRLILAHARELTNADAGSLYLVEGERERLLFKIALNESVPADLSEFSIPVTASSIVGSAVLQARCVRVDDLYADAEPD